MSNYVVGGLCALALCSSAVCQSLPQVDLGYEIHQAFSYNVGTSLKHWCQAGANRWVECFRFIQLQQHQIRATSSRRVALCSTGPSYRTKSHSSKWQLLTNLPSGTPGMDSRRECLHGSLCSRQCNFIQLHSCCSRRPSRSSDCCSV